MIVEHLEVKVEPNFGQRGKNLAPVNRSGVQLSDSEEGNLL